MVQPQGTEEDDLPPELPPKRDAKDEENYQPEDDSDLGLGDEREIGLDSDAGLDDALETEPHEDEEPGSWLDDGSENPSASVIEEDGLEADADDEDDLESSEPSTEAHPEDWEDDFGFDEKGHGEGDAGEEGFGDDGLLSSLDLEQLPPLDDSAAAEEEASIESDPLTADLIASMRARAGEDDDDELETVARGLMCTRMPAERVRVEVLQRSNRPLVELCAVGATGVAWDGAALLVAEPASTTPEPRSQPAGSVLRLAAARDGERVLIAIASPAGVSSSHDGGRSFAPASALPNAPGVSAALAFARTPAGPRLWAASAAGPLYASDDAGASFRCTLPEARVLRVASDGARAVLLLGRGERGAASALRSNDAGDAFEPFSLPVGEPERVQDLQVTGSAVLCCRRLPAPQVLLWSDRAQAWSEIAGAEAPALLIAEGLDPGVAALYFCVANAAGPRLVRMTVGATRKPQIVAELSREIGAVLQLAGAHRDGVTTLQVGTERAWLRVHVNREGGLR